MTPLTTMLRRWLRDRAAPRPAGDRRPAPCRLGLEPLEAREVPAVLARYEFGAAAPLASADADADSTASGVTVGAGLPVRFSTTRGNPPNSFQVNGQDSANSLTAAIAANDYVSFTVTPAAARQLDLVRLTFDHALTNTSATAKAGSVHVKSSLTGFSAADPTLATFTLSHGSGSAANGTFVAREVLFGTAFQDAAGPVEFRLYASDSSSDVTQYFDNLVLEGVAESQDGLLAPSNLRATPVSSTRINLSWADNAAGEDGFRVERRVNTGPWVTIATLGPDATSYADGAGQGLVGSYTYGYRVRAVGPAGDSAYSTPALDVRPLVTNPFTGGGDVGGATPAGSSTYANGTFTVNGVGTPLLSRTADQFHFVHRALTGDGAVVARVTGSDFGAAGLMIRNSLDADSPYAAVMLVFDGRQVNNASSPQFYARTAAGGLPTSNFPGGVIGYSWVRLVREGDTLRADVSANGATWTLAGTATVPLNDTVYVGLVAHGQAAGQLNTATFDRVSVTPTAVSNPAPVIVEPASAPGPVSGRGTTLGVRADDGGGGAAGYLTYSWSVLSRPAGAPTPTFAVNHTAAARDAVVTFSRAGTYTFRVAVFDGFRTTTSDVTVAVLQTPTGASPPGVTVNQGGAWEFDVRDQFGDDLADQAGYAWSVDDGGVGSIDPATGRYTAPAAATGLATVRVVGGGGFEAAAAVLVRDPGAVPVRTSHTRGEQRVLVIRWKYADDPGEENPPVDLAHAAAVGDELDAHFRAQSFGKTGLSLTHVPVFVRLDHPRQYYLDNDIPYGVEAEEAAAKAREIDAYYTGTNFHRTWYATRPVNLGSTGKAGARDFYVNFSAGRYVQHEIAHTYGLQHWHAVEIGQRLEAPARVRMGWLTATDPNGFRYRTVTAGGTYRVYNEDSALAVPNTDRALRIAKPGGGWYYLTARLHPNGSGGLYVTQEASGYAEGQQLADVVRAVDANPSSAATHVGAGGSFTLPGTTIRVTVLARTAPTDTTPAALDLSVTFG